jgi:hypothetical protein
MRFIAPVISSKLCRMAASNAAWLCASRRSPVSALISVSSLSLGRLHREVLSPEAMLAPP